MQILNNEIKPCKLIFFSQDKKILLKVLYCTLFAVLATHVVGGLPTKPTSSLNVPAVSQIAVGDLNNDGKPDIAAVSNVPGKESILIFFQNNGKFPASADMVLDSKAYEIQIADVDMDGKNDLIASAPNKRLNVFTGNDNFTKHEFYSVNQYNPSLVAGKLSAKTFDVLVGPVWRQFRPGLKAKQGYIYGPVKNNNGNPLICDFNLDGNNDILFTVNRATGLRLFYGPFMNIKLNPADASKFIVLNTPLTINKIAVGDLNSDGRPDIVASTLNSYAPYNRKTFLYFQNQPIGFSENASPSMTLRVCGSLVIADFDNNKKSDLAIAEASTGNIYLYLQKNNGRFSAVKILRTGLNKSRAMIAKDLNGDLKPDIIIAGSGKSKDLVNIFLNK